MKSNGKSLAYIEAPAGEKAIELRQLSVTSVITGLFAETTQEMVFFNPNGRPLEGSLTFPMPEGAVVCGYALDVEGRMVEGVIVAKQEARRVLEAEIRKGVDPGLMEQVAGNLYRTRIYPLPADGTRRVRITYVNPLTVEGSGAHYHLPIPQAAHLEQVAVRLEVRQSPVEPALSGRPEIILQAHAGCWVAEGMVPGDVGHDFHLVLPDLPERFALVERTADGEVFFCVSAVQPPNSEEAWRPSRLAVAWDASGSRSDTHRELELLLGLDREWPLLPVDLVVLRERQEAPQSFASLAELVDFLQQVPADGATSLAQLDLSSGPHPGCQAWLLFSDGLDTIAPALPKLGSLPVFPVTSQVANHGAWLQHVAERSEGEFLNLCRTPVAEAVRTLAGRPRSPRGVNCQGGTDLHLSRSQGRIQALGRLTPAEPTSLVSTGPLEALRVEAGQATPGRLLARAWAGRELAALQARGQDDQSSLELGRRYGLVTPGASLLVLESLEQYLEYDICPPESQPQLRQPFLARRQQRKIDRDRERQQHLDSICSLWNQRVAWWEQDFRPAWESFRARPAAKIAVADEVEGPERMPAFEPESAVCAGAPAEMMMDCAPMMCMSMAAPAGAPAPAPQKETAESPGASIAIRAWDPDTPYLRTMKEAGPEGAYQAYLRMRPEYAGSPSFFLDCADRLLQQGQREAGLRVLSNLLEMGLDDPPLMRMYAWRLQQAGELDGAVQVLERVLKLRPDEPQSYRDLGLALGDRWDQGHDPADAFRAAELLYEVVHREWDRFPEIELIALMELNRLLARAERAGVAMPEIDSRLQRLLDLDLRISMSWDADLTDVDLHVYEPTGEHAFFGHNRTAIGGLVSLDFRQGYGPEEYVLRRGYPGDYEIKAHYYGSHQQTLTGPCSLLVSVFTNYGRIDEERQLLTLRLDRPGSQEPVGVVTLQAGQS